MIQIPENERLDLAEAAVSAWEEKHPESVSVFDIAGFAGIPAADFYDYFPNKNAAFIFYYEGMIIRYRAMIAELDGYDELVLADKLTNFLLSTLDMMDEHKLFVQETFRNDVFANRRWHPFFKQSRDLIKEIIETHPGVSKAARVALMDTVYDFLAEEWMHLLLFGVRDSSEGKQKTLALADSFTRLAGEVLCFKGIDYGVDLLRIFWNEGLFKFSINIPFTDTNLYTFRSGGEKTDE